MPLSSRSIQTAFSLNRQADAATPVPDAQVKYMRKSEGFAPHREEHDVVIGDQAWYGGGNFGSFLLAEAKQIVVPDAARAMSDLDALWALYFCMGKVVSAENPPSSGIWEHTLTWQPITSEPEVKYTTMFQQLGDPAGVAPNDGWRLRANAAWISTVQINAQMGNFVQFVPAGGARFQDDASGATMPAGISAAKLMRVARTTLNLGPPTAPDISARWTQLQIGLNNNAVGKLRAGQPAGQQSFRARADIGDQVTNISFTVEASKTLLDYFRNETEVEAVIKFESDQQVGTPPTNVSLEITVPRIRMADENYGEEDRTALLTNTTGDMGVLEPTGGGEPITMKLTTDIDDAEIGKVAP